MKWPEISEVLKHVSFPEGYVGSRLHRNDIPLLIDSINTWYPDVSVGGASCYLTSDFYEADASLEGEEDKPLFVLMIRKEGELAGFISWDWEEAPQAVYARFGVVNPKHRAAGLGTIGMMFGEALGRLMGAGFIYSMCTLKMPNMQLAFERAGYKLLGFAPGYDKELVSPGVVKRVFEAYYAKILVSPDELHVPDVKNLTPQTLTLFKTLFPEFIPQ
jgi:Acetyltransferase (GNAT) family